MSEKNENVEQEVTEEIKKINEEKIELYIPSLSF